MAPKEILQSKISLGKGGADGKVFALKKRAKTNRSCSDVVRLTGVEPAALRIGVSRSIQLGYRRVTINILTFRLVFVKLKIIIEI